MDVNAEARRILAVSVSKLYASRTQRGGMRLHRSLLLSLVMRSARDIYHSSRESETPPAEPMESGHRAETDGPLLSSGEPNPEANADDGRETSEDKENASPARASRKRRGKASAAPDFLPSKRARLESGEERHAAPPGGCRPGPADCLAALTLNRVIPAF
ncbi:immediate early response 2b [Neosynchiropus ocellatus]